MTELKKSKNVVSDYEKSELLRLGSLSAGIAGIVKNYMRVLDSNDEGGLELDYISTLAVLATELNKKLISEFIGLRPLTPTEVVEAYSVNKGQKETDGS